ncbi:MAG: glycosyltransferase family 4 protein [Oscillochloris sp.]|nr:glycosyltransferase family 4 protein [Oscillochloris sp.]
MKIILPVHHFPPHYRAGAELYTERLARGLIAQGHTVQVVCVERIDRGSRDAVEAVYAEYAGVPVWRLSLDLRAAPPEWEYANAPITRWFGELLDREQPDLVHLQGGYLIGAGVLAAAQERSIATAVTLHDYWFLCPQITLLRGDNTCCPAPPADPRGCAWCMQLGSRRYRLPDQLSGGLFGKAAQQFVLQRAGTQIAERRQYLNRVLAHVDAAIAPSHFLAGLFDDLLTPEQIHVVRIGIDGLPLRSCRPRQRDHRLRLGYLGQVSEHKGVHLAITAIRAMPHTDPPVELHIYGDLERVPAYVARLRRMIGDDQRISLHGAYRPDELPAIFAQLDATIVPSIWYENSPLTILEAQLCNRPVITAAFGGMAELVQNDVNGLHFQAGDARDLARQIERLRSEAGLLERLAQARVVIPSQAEELRRLIAIYAAVLSTHGLEHRLSCNNEVPGCAY